jgi:regulator of sigma E protease
VNVFIAIFGLAFLVLVHEAGHFFTARLVGMSPRRFYIGFPPALVKVTRNGIEYGIGAIPLGGYVKIPGMHRPAPSDLDVSFGQAIREVPELLPRVEAAKRALGGRDLDAARAALPALEQALEDAKLSPGARRGAERALRELADGLSSDAYWRQRAWKKITVIFAGPGTNLAFAVVLFAILFMVGGGKATPVVDTVLAKHPAATMGLRPGDRILAIDGHPVTPTQISGRISGSRGQPITLTVRRDGRTVTLGPARPEPEQGAYRLGFILRGKGLSAPAAGWESVKLTGIVTREIGKSLINIVHAKDRKNLSSPVGIVRASSSAAQQGLFSYLDVLAFISLSLALLNLLPLLPLDGGHIAFSIVEGIRGRAVGREVYERVSAIGLAVVLLLFFIGLSNDVGGSGG